MHTESIESLTTRVLAGGQITPEEAQRLADSADKPALYAAADAIRAHFMGEVVDLCSIMNAQSGRCSEDCKWCSQSRHFQTGVPEYPLVSADEALQLAQENHRQGVGHFSLVTSGRALKPKQIAAAAQIYETIRAECDIALCASMGLLRTPELQKLKDAGVVRYHCNIETAPSHFPTLCSTHSFADKQRTIAEAQAMGMKICSGGIFGMGESMAQRIEMAFALRDMGVDSIPINILHPIEGTPLQGRPPLSEEEVLTSIALFRLINPRAHLRLAGGRNLIFSYQEKALAAGISAALVGDYLTTLGASIEQDQAMLQRLGRTA